MRFKHVIVRRCGKAAIVRVLPSGEAAGYDVVADRDKHQRHFQIHRDTPHATAIDAAFCESRQYATLDDAYAAATDFGIDIESR